MAGTKVKLEKELYDRVKKLASIAGYSSVEEFVTHLLEKELASIDDSESEEKIRERLQGLGYLS